MSVGISHRGVDGSVSQIANQDFFLAIAKPGHRQDRAGVGRDDRAQVAIDREPEPDVILRLDVLDPGRRRGHAVLGADQAILHVRRQARDRATGNAAAREALSPVAGHLQDRLQAILDHFSVGVERHDPPDRPSFAVIGECLGRDRNGLGPVGGARGHREHEHFGARTKERAGIAPAHAIDVRLVAIVAADRHASCESRPACGPRARNDRGRTGCPRAAPAG